MLRICCLTFAMMLGQPLLAQQAQAPQVTQATQSIATRLWRALGLEDLMPILRDEALAEAETMQTGMTEGGNQIGWLETVAQIHDPVRLKRLFQTGVTRSLRIPEDPAIGAAIAFYEGELGQRLVRLETSARQVMLDPDAEDAAREAFSAAASRNDPRVAQISRLIEEADLIGPNVAGGLNAAVAFSLGFSDGGGFDMPMSEQQMLADAWSQEAEIRAATLGWMEAYLLLAYSPLSDAELERYIGFAGSADGQALSALLFAGFDAVFLQTSRDLGLAAAGQMQGRDL